MQLPNLIPPFAPKNSDGSYKYNCVFWVKNNASTGATNALGNLAFTRKNSGYYCLISVFSVVKKFGFTATESANGALTKIEIQLFGTDKIILTAQ